MNKTILIPACLALLVPAVFAHVSLDEPRALAGSQFEAVLRVSHGCDGAATTALSVRLPSGFTSARALPKAGWTASAQGGTLTWTAGPGAALPAKDKGEFPIAVSVPRQPGPQWIKVLQTCEQGSMDWSQVPVAGTSTEGLKTPAVLLQVMSAPEMAAFQALPQVEGGWARASVPGQSSTGAYMRITARQPMELVGVITPLAGVAEVHEMKMEGDVMRMRPAGKLELPAGRTVELKPGGYHVMLQDLKQPVSAGGTLPVTLVLRDKAGAESRLELKLPVLAQAPGSAGDASSGGHKH